VSGGHRGAFVAVSLTDRGWFFVPFPSLWRRSLAESWIDAEVAGLRFRSAFSTSIPTPCDEFVGEAFPKSGSKRIGARSAFPEGYGG